MDILSTIFEMLDNVAQWFANLVPIIEIDWSGFASSGFVSTAISVKEYMNYFLGVGMSNAIIVFLFLAIRIALAFGLLKLIKFLAPVP